MNEVAVKQESMALLERVVVGGDLSKLSPVERVTYYAQVCSSVGLNPLTRPFEYISLNNKLTLYAKRDCTDQLRALHGVSCQIVGRELIGDIYVVTTRAKDKTGREDESTGAVNLKGKAGDDLANAYMKAETKSKRRVTLSICGLGILDESEVADIDPTTATPSDAPVVQMPTALPKAQDGAKAKKEAAPQQPGTINATQANIIRKKLEKNAKDETGFCQHFGIKTIEELPMAKVNDALAWAEGGK